MSDRVDVVVIGSGYGGSAVAARVAPHGRTLVLERGRVWRPGDFPSHLPGLAGAYHSRRNPLGLWGMRLGEGTGNAYVSGVGGASLVNYGITQAPEDHVFDDWPLSRDALAPYYARALEVLRPTPSPLADALGDKDFLDHVEPGRRVDLVNTIDWDRCTHCGLCVPGCNVSAKRSLDVTYLAIAKRHGAEVRAEREVVAIEPDGDAWRVVVRQTGARPGAEEVIPARHVVLAAGTFGTLDLLHRQRDRLPTTGWFGREMTMNGDGLAFLYNTSHPLSGHHGAPITTSVHLPFVDPNGRERTLNVMSGRIPKVAMRFSALVLGLFGGALGRRRGPRDAATTRAWRRFLDVLRTDPRGALAHTFMYKLDAEDSSGGRAVFDADGRSALAWPDYQDDPIVRFAARRLEEWAARVGGILVPDVSGLPGMRSFGVHPLGGVRMGQGPDGGVVDTAGRLFRPSGGVYSGLRVADASIIPSSLGVPSSLTVAALGERVGEDLAAELQAAA